MKKSYLVILLVAFLVYPLNAHAQSFSFNPNEIVSDSDFFRVADMSEQDIQEFLERKSSTLARYRARDIDGLEKSAAAIIHRAATDHGISPRVLLVLLQKEQSLIESQSPSQYSFDWATGFGVCDSCSVADPGYPIAVGGPPGGGTRSPPEGPRGSRAPPARAVRRRPR